MATVAIYNTKGGVGKSTVAVNLAWAAAASNLRTLLWDLDSQAASTFILGVAAPTEVAIRSVMEGKTDPSQLIQATAFPGLDLFPANTSLRSADGVFKGAAGQQRWEALLETLSRHYDCVVLDCPPGLGVMNERVIRGVSVILVPMIPSTLSARACDEICEYVGTTLGDDGPPIFPVFTMVDRRRAAHRNALATDPGFPVIPMASAVEMMADKHVPVGVYAPASPAALAFRTLWELIAPKVS